MFRSDMSSVQAAVPDDGWKEMGGPLVHLQFGRATPQQVFGADGWGLDWLLPPGGAKHSVLYTYIV